MYQLNSFKKRKKLVMSRQRVQANTKDSSIHPSLSNLIVVMRDPALPKAVRK